MFPNSLRRPLRTADLEGTLHKGRASIRVQSEQQNSCEGEERGISPRRSHHTVVGAGGATRQAVAAASGIVSDVAMSQPL